jgi:hypothetical protein
MGSGGLAQRCAIDLLRCGVRRVVLHLPGDEVLLPEVDASARYRPGAAPVPPAGDDGDRDGVEGVAGLEVATFQQEREVADVLLERPGPDDAILIIDNEDGAAVVSDRTLERLSLARVRRRSAGRSVPAFFLCCRGAGRAERLRNFVVDEVVDATSIEASYLTAFATVWFEVLPGYEAITHWPLSRRARVAHAIASRLCHLDVRRPDDVTFVEAGSTLVATAMKTAALVESDRASATRRGPIIGTVEFPSPGPDAEAEEVVVRVDIAVEGLEAPPAALPGEDPPTRLVVGIPYL